VSDDIQISVNRKPSVYEIAEQKKKSKAEEDIKQISAKLHPEYDQDLKEMIRKIPKRERSKLYRDAVRNHLQGMK
jgi:bifunctional N-acetylglucosamine-1-phosphate-uridyltransferase/glucosamine-1-phosphate-acetyltransferase GlmU-like protein